MRSRHSLTLPVDLSGLARKYGRLRFVDIPFEIDGITKNLKVSGLQPTILVNKNRPKTRQRFTLAHEIGHVIIPWHMGTIFDITDTNTRAGAIDYWDMEAEANAFATELLMPSDWVAKLQIDFDDPANITERIAHDAEVSLIAATLRLRAFLPPGYIFVVYGSDGNIAYSGRSDGTLASPPSRGEKGRVDEHYKYASAFYEFSFGSERYLWVELPAEVNLDATSNRDWRAVLNEILDDVPGGADEKTKYKQQLNGVFGYANGVVRRGNYNERSLCSACIQRLAGNERLRPITSHPKFPEFLASKVQDLIEKAKR